MKKFNILVVDDIFANRFILKEIIEDIDYNCIEASNGQIAIEKIENNDIDMVLLDIEMPVMNGLETVDHIRKKLMHPLNKIPVIALTAHNPSMFFDDFKDAGFTDLLTKPYRINNVTTAIEKAFKLSVE